MRMRCRPIANAMASERFGRGVGRRVAAILALGVPWLAMAQSASDKAPAGIYSCIDDKGRKLTADRPIAECSAREQRVLNRDGSVREVQPPTLTAEERAEKEARDRAAAEARAAQADAVRRDRNLVARYPSEAAHNRSREAALDTVRLAAKATELRLRDLAAERKPLLDEAEFYQGKALPIKLRSALDANDAGVEAQRAAISNQEAEKARINHLYDAELARLRALWAGAPAGSLGPLPAARPAASAASAAVKPAGKSPARPAR